MSFHLIKQAVAQQFARMSADNAQLYRTTATKDGLWETYLSSFPAGTNPMFRERTEHDCSCCKQFIRAVGNVVAIKDGKLVSLWDALTGDVTYDVVADKMSAYVKSFPIDNVFYHEERSAGADKTFEQLVDGQKTWEHFHVSIPQRFVLKDSGPKLNEARSRHDVFKRAMDELTLDSYETVLDLIAQGSLYRGEEYKHIVEKLGNNSLSYHAVALNERDLFAWEMSVQLPPAVAMGRNSAIGTLLVDLSEGVELEDAVKKFEAMVAPANYKRPTALVSKRMIEDAKKKIEELGLTSALERRYAKLTDINVNNILFADRNAKSKITGDVFAELAQAADKPTKSLDKVEEVPIEQFLKDILPRAESLEVLVENRHANNFVSLIAPVDPTAPPLFKWDNRFSWSYAGNLADSDIRKAVQARGGSVDGVFRFSHSWNHEKRNASLMDLHVFMPGNDMAPDNGCNDWYGNDERVGWNHRQHPRSGGIQDVDYVNEAPPGYVPVENITFPDIKRMPEGRYVCKIHNWKLRAPTHGGFAAEIELNGDLYQYVYDKPLKHKEWVTVAEVTLKNGQFSIKHHLPMGAVSKKLWQIDTQTFQKVNVVMMSPNYWEGELGLGNKHYFFMLDGCANDGQARGFYNEFLLTDLNEHRKVMEMVGSKLQTAPASEQLSGLGFSSTKKDSLTVRVKGSFTRLIKIVF